MLRYHIKISFFSEMKQDLPSALRYDHVISHLVNEPHLLLHSCRYYNAAYTMLIETLQQRNNVDRLLEMKIIAGIISYKVVK